MPQGAKVSGLSQRQLTDIDYVFVKNTPFFIQLKNCGQYWGYLVSHRATGQAHKPAPPVNTGKNSSSAKNGAGNWMSSMNSFERHLTHFCISPFLFFEEESEAEKYLKILTSDSSCKKLKISVGDPSTVNNKTVTSRIFILKASRI